MVTGARSFVVSYGNDLAIAGLISSELVATSKVSPSGGAFATAAVATMVPAPGRFSISTALPPQRADNSSPRMRATTSVGPPAANGTTSLTGADGKSAAGWAWAAGATNASASAIHWTIRIGEW